MPYLGIFGLEFENDFVIFEIIPSSSSVAKFREKTRMPKFGIKNALFGHFLARILKNYDRI